MKQLLSVVLCTTVLSACSGGGSESAPEPVTIAPPPAPTLTALEIAVEELKTVMSTTSPTGSYEGYILPESDDFLNIPQDPSNPITAEKVELGKFIYHETGITSTETNQTDMDNTWSCASCHKRTEWFQVRYSSRYW
jgi:cytochrome c peroxidase